jgi:2-polyprenyl-3-methyl-5-hydroxy-6-metoxy-1,4-benzoquinol methylase
MWSVQDEGEYMSSSFLKSLVKKIPVVGEHFRTVGDLVARHDRLAIEVQSLRGSGAERDRLAREVESLHARLYEVAADRDRHAGDAEFLRNHYGLKEKPLEDWSELKERKRRMSEEFRAGASTARLSPLFEPVNNHLQLSTADWISHQVKAEPYWFQNIEVFPGLNTSGWSDPTSEKLPYYGLPEDLTGMRVLDIGCAEGFFSFEAERRGAREVIGIDSFPESIRRFNIVKYARQSNASAFLMNVYDLEPRRLGTFDLVLFYGVFYHLKHPQLALERIRSICAGSLLFQTYISEEPTVQGTPWARFHPHGLMSGSNHELFDATVFWLFNSACCLGMLDHVGFTDLKIVSNAPNPFVVSARNAGQQPGMPPDQVEAPWC